MTTEKSIVEKKLPTLYYAVNIIRTVNSIRDFRSYGTRELRLPSKHGEGLDSYAIYRCYRIYRVCEGGNIFFNNLIAVKDKVALALESKENASSLVAGNRFACHSDVKRKEVPE